MSSITGVAARSVFRTRTVRQCSLALAGTLGLILVFGTWRWLEKHGFELEKPNRLAHRAGSAPMVALGVPHVLLGSLFLVTSSRVAGARSWVRLGLLAALGLGLCFLYSLVARVPNPEIPLGLVMIFFLVHHLRDEAYFYAAYREAPPELEPRRVARLLGATTGILLIPLACVGLFVYDVYVHTKEEPRMGHLDLFLPPEVGTGWRGLLLIGFAVLAVHLIRKRWTRADPEPLAALLRRNRPMLFVYGLFLVFVVLGGMSGTLFQAIIIWHVLEWLLFASARIAASEKTTPRPRGWLAWIKRTRRGFLTAHLGLAALVLALTAVWVYASGRTGPLGYVVGEESFYYLTIMHVSVSFYPR